MAGLSARRGIRWLRRAMRGELVGGVGDDRERSPSARFAPFGDLDRCAGVGDGFAGQVGTRGGGNGEDHERVVFAQLASRDLSGVAHRLLAKPMRRLGRTVKLKQQVHGRTARKGEHAVAVRCHALEQLMGGAFAVPLPQRAVLGVGFRREQREELVDFDVVRELARVRYPERVRVPPTQATTLDALVRGDDMRACLIEYPVIWGAARAALGDQRSRSPVVTSTGHG